MIHRLEDIARNRFLDLVKFRTFATDQGKRFVTDEDGVTSWHVDSLLKAYREHIGEETFLADRTRLIGEHMKKSK